MSKPILGETASTVLVIVWFAVWIAIDTPIWLVRKLLKRN